MISGGRAGSGKGNRGKMPCESCAVQFSVFKRKRVCGECERYYCSGCLRRGGGAMCAPCRLLSTRPLQRLAIAQLKVRDLQCFLQRQNVSTRGCVEKEELVSLCVSHVNSAAYRRRGAAGAAGGARAAGGAFTLKGFTTNINELITSAFDLRPPPASAAPAAPAARPAPPPHTRPGCCNTTHVHIVIPAAQSCPHAEFRHERFSVTPGGERDVRASADASAAAAAGGAGEGGGGGGVSRASSRDSARVESADCFEIEDVDDAGWEFVTRPADPLPNDSEVLLSTTDASLRPEAPRPEPPRAPPQRARASLTRELLDPALTPGGEVGVARAASELELRSSASADSGDTASLKDEPLMDAPDLSATGTPRHVTLESLRSAADLDVLGVRQLKELLVRNRVEFRGCIERADLLTRARMLYQDHVTYREELDKLPIEECCKICMAAPLECVLLECGHIAACTACAKQLAECPICRQYVVRAVRFFRS